MNKKIIFSAGGTGGHIFPAINLMKHFSEKGYQVVLVTDKRGNNFVSKYIEFKSYVLKAGTLTNKNFFYKILSLFVVFYSLIKSALILNKEKADLIIGFGGYVSFPISFVSKFFNLPLVIYEPNIILGRTNKFLLSSAKKILLAKKIETKLIFKYNEKVFEVGSILDKNIINTNFEKNFKKDKFSILILGGSQGAEIFGKIVPSVVYMIKKEGYEIEINQQCTKKQKENIVDFYKKNNIKSYVFEFEKKILKLILSSDIAITRSGASTTAELVHTKTPFIAVPLPGSIDNHQYLNAKFYKDKGFCWILNQNDFNTENLFNLLLDIIRNKNKLEKLSENMKKNYSNNVYSAIENQIKEII